MVVAGWARVAAVRAQFGDGGEGSGGEGEGEGGARSQIGARSAGVPVCLVSRLYSHCDV